MFSIKFGESGVTGTESSAEATLNRNKKLIIGVSAGAVLLGAIGGLVWYATSSVAPDDNVVNNVAGGGDKALTIQLKSRVSQLPPLQYLISRAKANMPLTIAGLVGLVVLIAVAIVLAIYLSTKRVSEIVAVVDDPIINEPEEPKSVPVWLIVVLVLLVLFLFIGGGFALKSGVAYLRRGQADERAEPREDSTAPETEPVPLLDPESEPVPGLDPETEPVPEPEPETEPKPDFVEEMIQLNNERNATGTDPICVRQTPTPRQKETFLRVLVQNPQTGGVATIHCATDYTPNSIWRAIMFDDARKEAQKDKVYVLDKPDGVVYKLAVPTSLNQINEQRIKGTVGTMKKTAAATGTMGKRRT